MLGPIRRALAALSGACAPVTAILLGRTRRSLVLSQAQHVFRSAFEDAPIGTALLTLDGGYAAVNTAFCELVDRSAEHLLAGTVESITHQDDLARDLEDKRSLLNGERTAVTSEKLYRHARGHAILVATQETLLCDEHGTPMCFLVQAQDITDRRRREQQLEYLADHDTLTGLLNRRAFNRLLDAHAAEVARYGPIGAVLAIDLDHFKLINDTLGHATGDTLLAQTARLLATRLRSSDVIARLGGDEFGVLLPRSDANHALAVAGSLLAELSARPSELDALKHSITASIGIATFDNRHTKSGDSALANADHAMYHAKQNGRNRVCMFDPKHRQSKNLDTPRKLTDHHPPPDRL